MNKQLMIKCEGSGTVSIDDVICIQGDLKSLTEENYKKLRRALEKEGFADPLNIWNDNGQLKNLDGNQRVNTLKLMRQDGWYIPPIPCNWIKPKDEIEARKMILTFSSNYGEITQESLSQYMIDSSIEFSFLSEEVVIPNVDFELDVDAIVEDKKEKEVDLKTASNECPECGFQWE